MQNVDGVPFVLLCIFNVRIKISTLIVTPFGLLVRCTYPTNRTTVKSISSNAQNTASVLMFRVAPKFAMIDREQHSLSGKVSCKAVPRYRDIYRTNELQTKRQKQIKYQIGRLQILPFTMFIISQSRSKQHAQKQLKIHFLI